MKIDFNMKSFLLDRQIDFVESEDNFQLKECPQCGNRKGKFGISKEKNFVSHCFRCGTSFNVYQFISLIDDISFNLAKDLVHKKNRRVATKTSYIKKMDIIDKSQIRPFNYNTNSIETRFPSEFEKLQDHIPYTQKRGLNTNIILDFNLHVCYSGAWKNRLIIPVYHLNTLVGWQGRDITNKAEKKIKSCLGFKKSKFILNYDKIKDSKCAVLCEGPFDVLCLFGATKKIGAFGIMGKKISTAQLNLLLKTKLETIFIGLDPDFPESREEAAVKLSQFFDVRMVQVPEGKDLGDLDKKQILAYLGASQGMSSKYSRLK